MAEYRLKRNLLKSLKTYFIKELQCDNWTGITVDLQNKKSISSPSPKILISIMGTDNQKREIGSGVFLKFPNIVIRIFGTDNGNREDLSDWVMEKLEQNIPYYSYTLQGEGTFNYYLDGNIVVLKILRDEHELANTDPSVLDQEDRYRHNITFSVFVGQI